MFALVTVWGWVRKRRGWTADKAPSGVVWGEGTGRVWIHTSGDLGPDPLLCQTFRRQDPPPFLTRPLPSPPAPTHQHRPPPQRVPQPVMAPGAHHNVLRQRVRLLRPRGEGGAALRSDALHQQLCGGGDGGGEGEEGAERGGSLRGSGWGEKLAEGRYVSAERDREERIIDYEKGSPRQDRTYRGMPGTCL